MVCWSRGIQVPFLQQGTLLLQHCSFSHLDPRHWEADMDPVWCTFQWDFFDTVVSKYHFFSERSLTSLLFLFWHQDPGHWALSEIHLVNEFLAVYIWSSLRQISISLEQWYPSTIFTARKFTALLYSCLDPGHWAVNIAWSRLTLCYALLIQSYPSIFAARTTLFLSCQDPKWMWAAVAIVVFKM